MIFDIKGLSNIYRVRRLFKEDVDLIYELCIKNDDFYLYHPPFVTKESIIEDMHALPKNISYENKYYVGFFKDNKLMAIMDIILGYPNKDIAFIGFFMMNKEYQNKGIGSSIVKEVFDYLLKLHYSKVQLGVDIDNPHSYAFWIKNGFNVVKQEKYILMELNLLEN